MEGVYFYMSKNTEKITIKIEGADWESALDASFKKNVKEKNVDGFRKGKVPKKTYLEMFGIESLYLEAVNIVADKAYKEALKKATLEPQVEPAMDIEAIDKDSVTFEFTIIGKPDVELGEYKNLKIKKDKVKVTDEEINHEIEHLREHFAEIREKEEGVVELGDTAVIDFKGFVDGEPLEGGNGENYPLEIGSNTFIPGFEEGVLGMKLNEEKDLHLKFPDNYVKDLAGKEVIFHVTLQEIKTRILPEINEDFFKDLGYDKVTNEAELKSEVKKTLEEEKKHVIEDEFLENVLSTASNNMKIEIPEEILTDEIDRMVSQFEDRLKSQNLTIDNYCEFAHTTIEKMREEMEPEATKRIKYRYLIEAVAEKEKIEVTDEEVEKDASEMAQNYGISKEELIKAFGSIEILKYDSKMRKTLNFLKENN